MPNWCYNNLTVSIHNESGKKLVQAFRDNHTNDKGEAYASPFTDIYPCPEELMNAVADFKNDSPEHKANHEKYGFSNWYDWRLANWGTKWDACEVDFIEETDEYVQIRFDTAWCSADKLLEWYAKENPDVVFLNQYDEEGMGFEGFESMSPESGFRAESWETTDSRIPRWDDLTDEIPEGEALGQK